MKTIQQIMEEERAKSQINKISEGRINKTIANREKANDPIFQEKRLDALYKVMQTDEWKQNQIQRGENRKNNSKLKKEQSELMIRQNLDPTKKEKRVSAMKQSWTNPSLKQKQSESSKILWNKPENKEKRKAQGLKRSKPIMTPDGEFQTLGLAGEYYSKQWNMKPAGAASRIKKLYIDKISNWFYIKKNI